MNKFTQFEPLVIEEFEDTQYRFPVHSHTYYEMIYILAGEGIHQLNHNQIPYTAGDLFLLSVDDEHYFDVQQKTHFAFIKFTDSYFDAKYNLSPEAFLPVSPRGLMSHKLLKETKLKLDEPCKTILKNTISNLIAYNCRKDVTTSPIVYYQILSIFGLVREALDKANMSLQTHYPDKERLITYLHQHIYTPDKIQIKQLSAHFPIAKNYFSSWFRKNFGISYREYINKYRLSLIEKRLSNESLTLKQIAAEFGFTDESHLSNYFKKNQRARPSSFRKLHQ